VGLGVERAQALPLPHGGREVVSERLSVQVHQTQEKEKGKENNEKSIAVLKKKVV